MSDTTRWLIGAEIRHTCGSRAVTVGQCGHPTADLHFSDDRFPQSSPCWHAAGSLAPRTGNCGLDLYAFGGALSVPCTVRRQMADRDLTGATRVKARRATITDPAAARPARLGCLLADLTYVPTWSGVATSASSRPRGHVL